MADELIDSDLLETSSVESTHQLSVMLLKLHKASVVFHSLLVERWCVQTQRAALWLVLLKQQKLQP